MSKGYLRRFATYSLAVAAICLFIARPAAADSADVVTLFVSGNVKCISMTCGSSTGTVTGTFSVDVDAKSIVGSWSFSTPDGSFSSGSSAFTESNEFTGYDRWDFCGSLIGSICTGGLELIIPENDPQEGGPILTGKVVVGLKTYGPSNLCQTANISGIRGTCANEYDFTSGTATVVTVTTTPEPSSLLLLGAGVLGLGLLTRHLGRGAACCELPHRAART